MIEQRSNEWFQQRLGMITASEFFNLMKNSRQEVPMSPEEIEAYKAEHPRAKNIPTTKKVEVAFSDATYTYLNRKVMERYIPKDTGTCDEYIETHQISNAAMRYGTDLEPMARDAYAEKMGCEVMEVEFVPLKGFETVCGVSSDGIVRGEKGGIELKCPFLIEHHLDYLLLETIDQLLEMRPEYYWQMRLNMLAWDLEWYDFVSYCPYVSPSKQLKILRMYRDRDIDEEMFRRLSLARDHMGKLFTKLNNIQTIIK